MLQHIKRTSPPFLRAFHPSRGHASVAALSPSLAQHHSKPNPTCRIERTPRHGRRQAISRSRCPTSSPRYDQILLYSSFPLLVLVVVRVTLFPPRFSAAPFAPASASAPGPLGLSLLPAAQRSFSPFRACSEASTSAYEPRMLIEVLARTVLPTSVPPPPRCVPAVSTHLSVDCIIPQSGSYRMV